MEFGGIRYHDQALWEPNDVRVLKSEMYAFKKYLEELERIDERNKKG